ncbi:hypothetical protein D9758_007893 [Tetrapyrgos nigripes]|uniref:Uncharacterized protein n=1 Tax=Tetrapyrgos nigripes TaxID=182062 RepID=A0A8H5FX37_9AGAR|nr:hypothetical protein D9758_007893 [Tetrapyrgos nigripes]
MLTILSKMSSNILMTTVPVFAGVDFNIWADILVAWLQATGLSSVLRSDRPDDAEVSLVSPLTDEDAAAQAEAITVAQKKQADWDEKNDKAMGSIKLRLSPPVRQKTLGMTTAKEIWDFLKKTYGKPGVSAIYTDFKRATSITIPNDANPSAAIELIRMHFDRVSAYGIPTDGTSTTSVTKVANFLIVMFIISKLPPRYEYLINQYTQYTLEEVDTANLDVLQSEIGKGKANFRRGGRAGKFEQAKRQGQAHLVNDDMSPMMHTVTVVDTPAAVDTRKPFFMETEKPFDAFFTGTKRAINLARDIGARPSGETVATLEDVVMSHTDPSSFTSLTPAPRPKRTLTERIYWDNLQSSSGGWGNAGNWNGWNGEYPESQTGSDADMACAQGEDASWNEDTLVNTSELGSVFGTTTTESDAKVSQDIRTPVPLIDRIAADPAAEMMECATHLGERFQNPQDPLHIYGEPLRAALNTVAPTGTRGTLSLVQRLAAVRSEMPSGSQPAPPNGMTTQSLPSSRVASPTPGTTSTGWEWLTPHLQNEDGRYDELIDWQQDATIGLGGMELPSRAPTPSSMPELRSVSPSLSETSDLEYMSTPPSIGRMSLPTSPVEATWSDGIPSPRPSTPVMVTVNAANNYGWSLDAEPNGMDNGYLRSYE